MPIEMMEQMFAVKSPSYVPNLPTVIVHEMGKPKHQRNDESK